MKWIYKIRFREFFTLWAVVCIMGVHTCRSTSTMSSIPPAADTASAIAPVAHKSAYFDPVIPRLLQHGMDTNFLYKLIFDPHITFNSSLVKINVTGYLNQKKVDYSHNYNAYSVAKGKEFIMRYDSVLTACQEHYAVPKEVITSILWVETKYGEILGKHNVPSVYLSIALADQPEFIQMNKDSLHATYMEKRAGELDSLDQIIEKRAKNKAAWAIDQLLALEKMREKSSIPIAELSGSWAGAFGMPQFIPSSYLQWGADGNGDGKVDLFEVPDAIYSVANYLKSNGWDTSEKSHKKAVFHYNNSSDYVDAVLTLAAKLRTDGPIKGE